jgi:hypothetical protein
MPRTPTWLVGRAKVTDDVAVKKVVWIPASYKWHPGGPTDPNVVLIDFIADRGGQPGARWLALAPEAALGLSLLLSAWARGLQA